MIVFNSNFSLFLINLIKFSSNPNSALEPLIIHIFFLDNSNYTFLLLRYQLQSIISFSIIFIDFFLISDELIPLVLLKIINFDLSMSFTLSFPCIKKSILCFLKELLINHGLGITSNDISN